MPVPQLHANTPGPGEIQWDGFTIRYAGADFAIPPGYSANRYVWWEWNGGAGGPLQAADTLPTDLSDDDLLLFLNKDGIPVNVQAAQVYDGSLIVPESILAEHLAVDTIQAKHIVTNTLSERHAKQTLTGGVWSNLIPDPRFYDPERRAQRQATSSINFPFADRGYSWRQVTNDVSYDAADYVKGANTTSLTVQRSSDQSEKSTHLAGAALIRFSHNGYAPGEVAWTTEWTVDQSLGKTQILAIPAQVAQTGNPWYDMKLIVEEYDAAGTLLGTRDVYEGNPFTAYMNYLDPAVTRCVGKYVAVDPVAAYGDAYVELYVYQGWTPDEEYPPDVDYTGALSFPDQHLLHWEHDQQLETVGNDSFYMAWDISLQAGQVPKFRLVGRGKGYVYLYANFEFGDEAVQHATFEAKIVGSLNEWAGAQEVEFDTLPPGVTGISYMYLAPYSTTTGDYLEVASFELELMPAPTSEFYKVQPKATRQLTPTMSGVVGHAFYVKQISDGVVAASGYIDVDDSNTSRRDTGMRIPEGMRPINQLIVSAPIVGQPGSYRYFFQPSGVIEFEQEAGPSGPYEGISAVWFTK